MVSVLPLRRLARLGLCVATLLACPWGLAAPAVSPAPQAASVPTATDDAPAMPPMNDAELGDQSRTIKLLLELQAAPDAAAQADARPRGARAVAGGKASDAKAVPNALIDPDGPFGAPAPSAAASSAGIKPVDWQGELGVGASPAALGGHTAAFPTYEPYASPRPSGAGPRSEGGSTVRLLPPELLQWLREHRVAIIGTAVVVLVLGSLGAAVSAQRQR